MYDKVLIISDNVYLCREFKKVITDFKNTAVTFRFAGSPFSNIKDFKGIKISILDLKNPIDIQYIISNFNLVFSIHCKQIFPSKLLNNTKCINIHPGYNPINRGWYPQVFSIINDLPIGVTIHEIDEKLDNGAIIVREYVQKFITDTSETLYNRILKKEIELLNRYLPIILENKYKTILPETEGNLFLKKNFNDLLKIDLDEQCRVGDLINKLRALTHGNFKNAYFIDKETGNKVYIGIQLKISSDERN
jgi:methionyl-tRNA formyltransferase